MTRLRSKKLAALRQFTVWLVLPAFAVAQTAQIATTTQITAPTSPQTLQLPGSLNLAAQVTFGQPPHPCCGVPTGSLTFSADGVAPNPIGSAPLKILPSTQTMAFGTNYATQYNFAATGSPTGLATGSFFADGQTDVAVTDSADAAPIFFQGQGHGQILQKAVTVNNAPDLSTAKGVAAGDFTGKGTADLIFLGLTNNPDGPDIGQDVVYLNQGGGAFNAVVSTDGAVCNSCSALIPFDVESITVGNFNADQANDIAYITGLGDIGERGGMGIAFNAGNGSFPTFTPIALPNGTDANPDNFVPTAITSGNFDGHVDLVVTGTYEDTTCTVPGTSAVSNGYVVFYSGDGNGNFAAPQTVCAGENPSAIAIGDFNNDKNLDILVANNGIAEGAGPTVQVLLGNGTGGFTAGQTVALTTNSGNLVSLLAADFNGDTYSDFDVYDSNGNQAYYTNGGSASPATFQALITLPTATGLGPTPAFSAATADFNADGFPDVITFFLQELTGYTPPATATAGTLWIATDSAFAQATIPTPSKSLQAGQRSITASYPGDANFAASASTPLAVAVSQTVPLITWDPGGVVYGTALNSSQLNATTSPVQQGGTFTYTPPAGTYPPAPTSPPTPFPLAVLFTPVDTFDYTSATDSVNLVVPLPPVVATVNAPTSATPGGPPPAIALNLGTYPVDEKVTITLSFTPSSSNPPLTNGSVSFASGTQTDTFTITANSSAALQPIPFSPGTVAGAIAISFAIVANGTDVTPANLATPLSVEVPAEVPVVQSTNLDCSTSTVVNLVVKGYSSTREISGAQASFTAAPGKSLQTSSFPLTQLPQLFTTFYQSSASDAGGSSFTLTQPFTFSSGDSSDISGVSVTLTNGQGTSQTYTAQCSSSAN